jgi:hypothetical protein
LNLNPYLKFQQQADLFERQILEDDSIIVSDEEGIYVVDINFLFKKKMNDKESL